MGDKSTPVEKEVLVLFAFEGTPEVSTAFQDIFKELIASNSINYEQARTIEEEYNKGPSGNSGGYFTAYSQGLGRVRPDERARHA